MVLKGSKRIIKKAEKTIQEHLLKVAELSNGQIDEIINFLKIKDLNELKSLFKKYTLSGGHRRKLENF